MIPDTQRYLYRPHIYNLLEMSIKKPIINVVAGAGFGKTVAVSTFLQDYDAATIWIQLSEFDNLIMQFWSRFVNAISLQNEKFAAKLESLGFPDSFMAYNNFIELVSSEIAPDIKLFVVFDDLHLITDKIILQFIEKLVYAQIEGLSIILISRVQPDINTVGLLSKGLISNITESDLRFKKNEMINFFEVQGIQLSKRVIFNIYTYTEGWIFAIYLISLPLKKGVRYEKIPLSAAKQDIFKLIENEVFSMISEELKTFLIKLSLVDNLPMELLQLLSSGNTALLTEMAKTSSFIRYDVFLNTYKIHHLLLDFLNQKQHELEPKEIEETYLKAADWYAKNGYRIDAMTYYERIGHYDEIIKIMLTYVGRMPNDTADFMIGIIDRMPAEFREEKPITTIIHANLYTNKFMVEVSYSELTELRQKYEALPPTEENRAILGETYIILGFVSFIICFVTGTHEYRQLYKMADEYLPSGSRYINNNMHLSACNYVCYVSKPGGFKESVDALVYTMPYAAKVMNGCGYGYGYLALTEMAFFQRNLKNAEKYAYQAIYKSREKVQFDIENMAVFYLVRLNMYKGDYSKIISLLEQFKQQVEKYNHIYCKTMFDITEGWFYTQIGESQRIANWFLDIEKSRDVTMQMTFNLDNLIRAKCYLVEKRYYELLALLEQQAIGYENSFLLAQIYVKILKAIALYRIDQQEDALMAFQEAYNLSNRDSLIMQFIEYGQDMRTLAQTALRSERCTIPKEWLNSIYTKSSTYAKKLSHITNAYKRAHAPEQQQQTNLSRREVEVLSDLCHGLTRDEIADNRNLSVNTVKTILQNIYVKLGAANSKDAIHIAISRNIVS